MAEPKNRHDPTCEVWTGDGPCTCGTSTNHSKEHQHV
jgi:hypothetical protein